MFAAPRSASFRPSRTGFYDGYLDALMSLGAVSEEAVVRDQTVSMVTVISSFVSTRTQSKGMDSGTEVLF